MKIDEKAVVYLDRESRHLFDRLLQMRMEEATGQRLPVMEGRVLGFISRSRKSVTNSELYHNFFLYKSTISAIVASLKEKGFVEEVAETKDGRKKILIMTEKGAERIKIFQKVYQDVLKTSSAGISQEEREAFNRVYVKVYNNLREAIESEEK